MDPTVNVSTDVGDVAMALAQFFKLGDDLLNILNSPQMQAARKSASVQAELEKMDAALVKAKKTGDLTEINKEASG